ncbi:uncharacterized protein LOC121428664 [Lytechinus variegatus]|uniref:uncharacterized protein LOC121428664 n=1 Tax=Lytechinus variegatus TaxID=7654 RepID=UPI001BB295AD|nr:uncharacterized protein LOC121428664 [Lytechinus variegatus]XP_041481386.1 uncharacterized protein LOC121428664 [Lytechinus variegatus]
MSQTTGSKDSPRQGPNQACNITSQNNTKEDGAMKDDGGKKTPNIARSKRGTGFKIPLKGKVKTPSQARPEGKTAKTPTPDELTHGTSVTLLGKIPKVKGAEFSLDDSDKFETIPVNKKAKVGESGKDVKTSFHPPDDTDIASAAWFMKMFQAAQKCMNLSNQPIAGDTSAPTRSAAQTKTRPDSPGAPTPDGPLRRDGVPAKRPRPGQRDIESRTRGRSPSTCHAPSIDINEDDSNSEYGYHRPIASRKRKWADSLLSQLSTSGSERQSIASGRYEKEGVSVISEGFSSAIFASSPSSRHDSVESKPVSAADLITKYCPQLKAETTDSEESKPIFCLDSELGRQSVNSAAVKLDKPFSSCLNYLNDRGRDLRPTNRVVKKHFRFGERDFKHAFKTPTVPDAAFCVGDAKAKRSRYSNQNPLGSRRFKRMESQLTSIDQTARASMRLATYHTYLLTAFRESEKLGISPEDRRDIWECVMKIAEYQFEQASRTAILCTRARRSQVIDLLQIEKNATRLLERLPAWGDDLFSGRFQEVLESSISASSTADKTVYRLSSHSYGQRSSSRQQASGPSNQQPQGPPQREVRARSPQTNQRTPTPFRGRRRLSRGSQYPPKHL